MIWECTLHPRVFHLVLETLQRSEETSASPGRMNTSSLPDVTPNHDRDGVIFANFSAPDILSPGALHASRESRCLVFRRGYRVWKMHDGQGRARAVVWNPNVDVILFPPVPGSGACAALRVHYSRWLRYFAIQYPEETEMARNVAVYTSMGFRSRPWGGRWHWLAELAAFGAMTELVVVVDEEAERAEVEWLMRENRSRNKWGPWKIPVEIEDWFEEGRLRWPFMLKTPVVRVVESSERVLGGQSLQICLRCNPCEYLGMG